MCTGRPRWVLKSEGVTDSYLWIVAKGAQRAYAGCTAGCACGLRACLHQIFRSETARACWSEHQQALMQIMERTSDMAELLVLTATELEAAAADDPVQQGYV